MPKYPAARLNRALTFRAAQMTRAAFIPNLDTLEQAIEAQPLDDPDELIDAMTDTMLHGMKVAHGINPGEIDPELLSRYPQVFKPRPGRQLWGWTDIHRLTGHIDYRQMAGVALRPAEVPVTPLHAFTAVRDRMADVAKLTQDLMGEEPLHHTDVSQYLKWQNFGSEHNEGYFLIDYHHLSFEPPRNSRRTSAQHFALQLDPKGSHGIQELLMKYPPVQKVLDPVLNEAYQAARQDLQNGPDNAFVRETHALLQSPTLPPRVARIVLGRHQYNGPTPWHRLFDRTISPTEHADLMVARQVTQNLFTPSAIDPYITLAISLLTGCSPAAFALAALERLEKTATTFLTEGCLLKIIDLITALPEPRGALQKEQQEDLQIQLEELARRLAIASDSLPPNLAEEVYDMLHNKGRLLAWGRV